MYKKCEEILNKLQSEGKIKISDYQFPPKQELKLKLKDVLEDEVDEKYYLSEDLMKNIKPSKENIATNEVVRKYGVFDTETSKHQAGSVYDENGLSPTLDTMQGGYRQPCIEIKEATKQGYKEAYEGDGVNISSRMKWQRWNVQKESIQTITTSGGNDRGVVVKDEQK